MGMIINPYRFVSAGLLLDTYTGAAAAYSLRKLRTAYTGYCIEVRRSSDDTTQNIGFTSAGVLDESALTTFCGAGNGFVKTWYDQSENGNDAIQETNSYQPKIVGTGTVIKTNNKPTINSVDNNTLLISASPIERNVTSLFVVANPSGTGTNHIVSIWSTSGPILRNSQFDFNIAAATYVSYTENGQSILTSIHVSNYGNGYVNGTYKGQIARNNLDQRAKNIAIMNYEGRGYCFGRDIQEVLFWITDKTSDRSNIETNINSFYSIY